MAPPIIRSRIGALHPKGNKLYAHVFEESIGPINLIGMADKVKGPSARGRIWCSSAAHGARGIHRDAFVNFARPEHFTYPLPDKRNTVIELELHDESDRS